MKNQTGAWKESKVVCQTIDQTTFSSSIKRIVRLGNGMDRLDTVSRTHVGKRGVCASPSHIRQGELQYTAGPNVRGEPASNSGQPTLKRERLRSSEHGGPRSWSPVTTIGLPSRECHRFVLVCDLDHEHVCGSICCRGSVRMLVPHRT